MNPEFVDQYLRAIAKRTLPIFQSNNFTYLGGIPENHYGHVPTEDELYNVLKELYRYVLRGCKHPRFKVVSLGRFHMFFKPKSPIGIEVLLDINDHEWIWCPEKIFKEQSSQDMVEVKCPKTN